jgi:hypothetical protein
LNGKEATRNAMHCGCVRVNVAIAKLFQAKTFWKETQTVVVVCERKKTEI